MKVPYKWICEWFRIETRPSLKEVITAIEQLGIEIESVTDPSEKNQGLKVCRIEETSRISPNSHLQRVTIFDGSRHCEVICGAKNCRSGLNAVFAPVGARLVNGLEIKTRHFGQVASQGMLCGWDEVGLTPDILGIIELPLAFEPGDDLFHWLSDPLLELGITPNLGHCLSIRGLAREIAQVLHLEFKTPPYPNDAVVLDCKAPCQVKVKIETSSCLSLNWCSITIEGDKQPSTPPWLIKRLWQCGLRSINFIVDATNYTMLELGQPMHAYDLNSLEGSLEFKSLGTSSKFFALGNKEILANEGDLVAITKKQQIASLAGVIGSAKTAVSETTSSALIESAYFSPVDIQRTSRRLNLFTEASRRMERGTDPADTAFALRRFCALAMCNGFQISAIEALDLKLPQPNVVFCRLRMANQLLGLQLSHEELGNLLKRCSLKVGFDPKGWFCTAPSYRHDLKCEVDFISEIARLKGLSSLPIKSSRWSRNGLPHDGQLIFWQKIGLRCNQFGFAEILSQGLISQKWLDCINESPLWKNFKAPLSVKKPKSEDHQYLRTGLLANFLQVLLFNQQMGEYRARFFEIARIYCKDKDDQLTEQSALGLMASGNNYHPHWSKSEPMQSFYTFKGDIEDFLESLGIIDVEFSPLDQDYYHRGRAAKLIKNAFVLGNLGQLHPRVIAQLGIHQKEVFYCELSPHILRSLSERNVRAQIPPNFPGSQRDWTLTFAEDFSFRQLVSLIPTRDLLISVNLLDIYRNEQLGEDRKNMTLRFSYKSSHQTLSQAQVDQEHDAVTQQLRERLGKHLLNANLFP